MPTKIKKHLDVLSGKFVDACESQRYHDPEDPSSPILDEVDHHHMAI